jgi:hypothetical protein
LTVFLLYEDHAVVGRELGQFEAVCRDEWMPGIAASVDGRLLWYFDRLLGAAHHVVTVCALRDGDAFDHFAAEMRSGKLADVVERLARLRYNVSGKILIPAAWSPPLSLDDVPSTVESGDAVVYLENVAWPCEPLPAFVEQLGASYASLWSGASDTAPPVELVAALHTVPAGPGPQMTVLQRVNDPMGFLSNVVVKLPPDHPVEQAKARGLEHRDRFESNLLMTTGWSPCR